MTILSFSHTFNPDIRSLFIRFHSVSYPQTKNHDLTIIPNYENIISTSKIVRNSRQTLDKQIILRV